MWLIRQCTRHSSIVPFQLAQEAIAPCLVSGSAGDIGPLGFSGFAADIVSLCVSVIAGDIGPLGFLGFAADIVSLCVLGSAGVQVDWGISATPGAMGALCHYRQCR